MQRGPARGWRFFIDRGGTFTDIVALGPNGVLETHKLLSENPGHYADPAVEGMRRCLARAPAGQRRIEAVKIGTTVATNALLERRGEPTVLVTTAGFGDVLRIGTQQRPDIFALAIELPEPLYTRVVEARERIGADGRVLEPLDEADLRDRLAAARADGLRSAAIVFMHGYRFAEHERRAAAIATELGFVQVSLSSQVCPLIRFVDRGDTTTVDAYLTPVLRRYVDSVRTGLRELGGAAPLAFMQSHGGLVAADRFRGRDSILSGPAGGVVGMAAAARGAGFERVIGFDMGGTSTDVSLYAGRLERTGQAQIGGVRVTAPMLDIHTVAAGGGSILKFAAGRLQAGPESAGADPGPACYRRGGPLTVTDANVFLGRIQPAFFPAVFGAGADEPLDTAIVAHGFETLAAEAEVAAEELAAGFLAVAVEHMAAAIKKISVQRGHDTTEFALCCFGGAGGQLACRVADELGIETVLIHRLAGVLSAFGVGVADLRTIRVGALELALDDAALPSYEARHAGLAREATAELRAQGVAAESIELAARLHAKIAGADTTLPLAYAPGTTIAALLEAFRASHRTLYGFVLESETVVVESLEVEARAPMSLPEEPPPPRATGAPVADARARLWTAAAWQTVPVYRRESLAAGHAIAGPAIVAERNATTVIEPEWSGVVDANGQLVLRRERAPRRRAVGKQRDPIMLEIFNSQFMHVAEQMGVVLQNTAHSVNIKERLDYSCAVFDADGALIANAPHVPVHLGSMGESVRAVLTVEAGKMRSGDVFMLNSPYAGGTHLPDVTVVTPAFDARGALRFVVASRAHHADIGGITPGSMPASSTTIHEEGAMIECMPIVRDGRFRAHAAVAALTAGRYPARNPAQNLADLKAQVAANEAGIAELEKMTARFGAGVVRAYMSHIQRNAEESVRAAIESLAGGSWRLEMDGGERIAVDVRFDRARREAVIDFAGTSGMSARNFNAPAAIARAVVLYVFRTLVREPIPLNAGCLKPLRIVLPPHSLLDPDFPAAVVAGNVETSQCLADALLAALGVCAASQGTMNNLTFGGARHQYYETLCGGAGAGNGFAGASAVHTHMTNSKLTDPEILEVRFPVRLRRFAIRRGSGGSGRWPGGNGVVRELEFLEPMDAAILSNRRRTAPFGLAGGSSGLAGRNLLVRRGGATELLPAAVEIAVEAGDRLVIETPGGGGFGAAARTRRPAAGQELPSSAPNSRDAT